MLNITRMPLYLTPLIRKSKNLFAYNFVPKNYTIKKKKRKVKDKTTDVIKREKK